MLFKNELNLLLLIQKNNITYILIIVLVIKITSFTLNIKIYKRRNLNMVVEKLLKTIVDELEKMIETKTIVGEPITVAGKTIIPVSKVCFGFGSGGGEDPKEEKQEKVSE